MQSYQDILENIKLYGTQKGDRTGTGTVAIHANNFRHNMALGYPQLTTKFVSFKNILTEWKWMMSGMTDVRWLHDNGCTIWDEWATITQCRKFQRVAGDLGPVYGHQWRNFGATRNDAVMVRIENQWADTLALWGNDGTADTVDFDKYPDGYTDMRDIWDLRDRAVEAAIEASILPSSNFTPHYKRVAGSGHEYVYGYNADGYDQIAWLLKELKFNPDSRRLLVSGWNPKEANEVALPPCHTLWQLQTMPTSDGKRKLNLMLHQRSMDVFLGCPYNISFYAFTIAMFAEMFGMEYGELVINSGDTHVYNNHQDAVDTQLSREPNPLPQIEFDPEFKKLLWIAGNSIKPDSSLQDIGKMFTNLVLCLRINEDVYLEDYSYHPAIKADVAV